MNDESAAMPNAEPRRDILVVDDDRDLADSLAQLLRLEGYSVETAYSADDAIEIVKQYDVAVALVDIRLGQRNGVQLIRELRTGRPEVMAIMMTAYASVDTAVQAIQEGAYDYLCKPFFTEDLIATLERCFERRKLLREREEAEAAVRARNRELKDMNVRLGRILGNMQLLARYTTARALCGQLLSATVEVLRADGGALYLREGEALHMVAVQDGQYPKMIALPPAKDSVLHEALAREQPAAGDDSVGDGPFGSNRTFIVFPLLDSRGSVLGALFIHDDGSAQLSQTALELGQILGSFGAEAIQAARATESLAESQEQLSKIIENSPSAIALMDLQGRYLLSNRKFDDWFGGCGTPVDTRPSNQESPDQEETGTGVGTQFVPDPRVIARNGTLSREIDIMLADGQKHTILVTNFPVVDGVGEPVGVGTIGTDITEQRQAEQRLRLAQRMEAIGQLTGGVAHDFNNLLSVILGNLRLLQEETAGQPQVWELLEEALDASKAGAELTSRLLAFGRGQTLRPEMTDVRALVVDMSRMLERTLGEGITIQLDLPSDLWHAEIDRNQLETSVLNLAINARDAMPNGGELMIHGRNVSLGDEEAKSMPDVEPGDYLMLSIMDSGEGMTEEVLRNAVQPFFTTKAPGHGSGLGLSMVYGFVKQSKGHLDIVSEVGQGTSVSLYFPAGISGPAFHASGESGASAGGGQGELVLVVEDQPNVRRLMRRVLTRLGYRVLEAADGRSALHSLEDNADIDVLLTDIVLPGEMNGLMLGRAALAANPGLRVIYTTGYAADSPAIGQDLQDATTILLPKPVQIDDLSQALRTALNQRRPVQSDVPPGTNM